MKKQSVIKSERVLNQVSKLIFKKVCGRVYSIWGSTYKVEIEDWVKGNIKHIIVSSPAHHLMMKCVIDTVWEVVDEYEKKYGNCVCGLIDTRPYLASDNETWLHMPVIEIAVCRKEN